MKRTVLNSFVTYFAIIVMFILTRVIYQLFIPDTSDWVSFAFTLVVQVGILFVFSIFMFSGLQKQKVKTTFKFYGYKKISFKAVMICIVLGVVLYFINIYVATFFDDFIALLGWRPYGKVTIQKSYGIDLFILNLIFTAVLPAVCEETVHRGMLLKSQSVLGSKWAILMTGLMFGLLHLNISQFFYATVMGVIAGYLVTICDSIYPAIIVHFMNNALSVLAGFSIFHNLQFSKIINLVASFANNGILGYAFLILLFILFVYMAFLLIRLLFMETTGKTMMNLQKELYKELAKSDYMSELRASKAQLEGKQDDAEELDLEQLYINKNIKMGLMTELDGQLLVQTGKYKMTLIEKVMLGACIVLTAGCTLFTLIWGIIC